MQMYGNIPYMDAIGIAMPKKNMKLKFPTSFNFLLVVLLTQSDSATKVLYSYDAKLKGD